MRLNKCISISIKIIKICSSFSHLHRQAESSPDSSLEKNLINNEDPLKEN